MVQAFALLLHVKPLFPVSGAHRFATHYAIIGGALLLTYHVSSKRQRASYALANMMSISCDAVGRVEGPAGDACLEMLATRAGSRVTRRTLCGYLYLKRLARVCPTHFLPQSS